MIPKFNYPPGATPTEISHHSLDLSYTLEQLMLGYDGKGPPSLSLSLIFSLHREGRRAGGPCVRGTAAVVCLFLNRTRYIVYKNSLGKI